MTQVDDKWLADMQAVTTLSAVRAAHKALKSRQPTTTPPPVDPPPTQPPPTATTRPKSWNDFPAGTVWKERTSQLAPAGGTYTGYSWVDSSGQPSIGWSGYTLDTFRMKTREGPRCSGGPITLRNGYIECYGVVDDHADGIQGYQGGGMVAKHLTIMCDSGCNAGIFFSDHGWGVVDLEDVYVGLLPGASRPPYGLSVQGIPGDYGADGVKFNGVRIQKGISMYGMDLRIDVPVLAWNDVRWVNSDGSDAGAIANPRP